MVYAPQQRLGMRQARWSWAPSRLPGVTSPKAPEELGSGAADATQPAGILDSATPTGIQDTAEFDALPVLAREQVLTATYYRAGGNELARSVAGLLPAMQAAAAAAGGFLAGAALVSFRQRRQRRALARRRAVTPRRGAARAGKSPKRPGELLEVVASRSLLVDVHLLGGRE